MYLIGGKGKSHVLRIKVHDNCAKVRLALPCSCPKTLTSRRKAQQQLRRFPVALVLDLQGSSCPEGVASQRLLSVSFQRV